MNETLNDLAVLAIAYLIAINLIAFGMTGVDKQRARRSKRRIPEARLFAVAVMGGAVGVYAAMHVFRHKTKHRSFMVGIPAILVLQAAAAVALMVALG